MISTLPPIKKRIAKIALLESKLNRALEYYYFYLANSDPSPDDLPLLLQKLEAKFGGYINHVEATVDAVQVNRIYPGTHTGGDRMNILFHDYSLIYSEYIASKKNLPISLLEIGILKGTGLAVFSKFFDKTTIIGFNHDTGIFENNYQNLLNLGAFEKGAPIVRFFDQFSDNTEMLQATLVGNSLDIVIDDAFHSDESIINSFIELRPYLSAEFVYFIEDNRTAWKKLSKRFPEYDFNNFGEITVVVPRKSAADTV